MQNRKIGTWNWNMELQFRNIKRQDSAVCRKKESPSTPYKTRIPQNTVTATPARVKSDFQNHGA